LLGLPNFFSARTTKNFLRLASPAATNTQTVRQHVFLCLPCSLHLLSHRATNIHARLVPLAQFTKATARRTYSLGSLCSPYLHGQRLNIQLSLLRSLFLKQMAAQQTNSTPNILHTRASLAAFTKPRARNPSQQRNKHNHYARLARRIYNTNSKASIFHSPTARLTYPLGLLRLQHLPLFRLALLAAFTKRTVQQTYPQGSLRSHLLGNQCDKRTLWARFARRIYYTNSTRSHLLGNQCDKRTLWARFARRIYYTTSTTNIFRRLALLAGLTKPKARQTYSLGLLVGSKNIFPNFPKKKNILAKTKCCS
jgi:hypothetical protein